MPLKFLSPSLVTSFCKMIPSRTSTEWVLNFLAGLLLCLRAKWFYLMKFMKRLMILISCLVADTERVLSASANQLQGATCGQPDDPSLYYAHSPTGSHCTRPNNCLNVCLHWGDGDGPKWGSEWYKLATDMLINNTKRLNLHTWIDRPSRRQGEDDRAQSGGLIYIAWPSSTRNLVRNNPQKHQNHILWQLYGKYIKRPDFIALSRCGFEIAKKNLLHLSDLVHNMIRASAQVQYLIPKKTIRI